MRGGQRRSRESWKTTLGSQGPKRKQLQRQPKKSQLTLSQDKMKKGDDVANDIDDYAVRTTVSQE